MAVVGTTEIAVRLALEELEASVRSAQALLKQIPSQVGPDTAVAIAGLHLLGATAQQVFGTFQSFAQKSVGSYLQFEGQLNSFKAIASATKEETAALGAEAKRLGIETSKTPGQAAAAAVELAKLGFSAKDATRELGGLVQLAEAGGSTMEVAASVVGASTNVYQRSAKDIANVVAATANATAADVNDFLQAISKAGAVAKSNNQDMETLAAAFGLMRSAGFGAESAATAVKTAITRLAAPSSKQAKEGIAELGVSIRDQAGNMRNFIDLVPEFRAAFANITPAKKAELVKTIFGDEGGPAFLALMETSQAKIDETVKTIRSAGKNDAAADTSKKLLEGLPGIMKLLQGSAETASLAIGEALAPSLNVLANVGLNVINTFLGLDPTVQKAIVVLGAGAIAVVGLVGALTTLEMLQIRAKVATIAATAAQVVSNAVVGLMSAATAVQTVSTMSLSGAMAALTGTVTAAAGGMGAFAVTAGTAALSIAAIALPLAAAAGAVYAISAVWSSATAGLKQSGDIDAATESIQKLGVETKGAAAKAGEFDNVFQKALSTLMNKGPVEGMQSILLDLQKSLFGGTDAADKYGNAWGLLTNQQLANQRVILALENQSAATNAVFDKGQDVLKKYGLQTLDAGDKQRLGAAGIAEFKKEALAQTQQIDKTVEALKAVKLADAEQQAIVNANIQNLERQKAAIAKRVAALSDDTNATKVNTGAIKSAVDALKQEQTSLEGVTKAYEAKAAKTELAAEEDKTWLQEDLASGAITEQEAAKDSIANERWALEERLRLKEEFNEKLKEAKESATKPEDKEKIGSKLEQNELEQQRLRTQIAENGYKERQRVVKLALDEEAATVAKSNNKIKSAESDKFADIRTRQLAGKIDAKEAEREIQEARSDSTAKQILAEQERLVRLKDLRAKNYIDEKKFAEEEAAISSRVKDLKVQHLEQQLAAKERVARQALEDEAAAAAKSSSKIKAAELDKISAIRATQLAGNVDAREADRQIQQAKQDTTAKQILAEQERLGRLKDLRAKNYIDEKKFAEEEAAISIRLKELKLQQVEQEIQARQRARDLAIAAIEDESRARQRAYTEQAAAIALQEKQLEQQQKAGELGKQLLESRRNLQKTSADAAFSKDGMQLAKVDKAVSAAARLKEGKDTDPEVKAVLQRQIKAAGFDPNASELDLLKAKDALEQQVAARKLAALEQEQQFSQQMLEIDLRRTELQSKQALLAAQKGELDAQNAVAAAGEKVRKAEQIDDEKERARAIADAQLEVTLAAQGVELAKANSQLAQDSAAAQKELAANARESLSVQQQMAKEQISAAEAARQQASSLQVAESAAKATADANKATVDTKNAEANSGSGNSGGGGKVTNLNLTGQDIWRNREATDMMKQAIDSGGNQRLNLLQAGLANGGNNKFFDVQLNASGFGNIAELIQKIKSVNDAGFGIKAMSAATQAQMSGKDPIEAINNLVNEVKNLAAKPSQLTVNSNNPVKDAAAIYGSLSKRSVSNANL